MSSLPMTTAASASPVAAAPTPTPAALESSPASAEDEALKVVQKRYEGLMTVRNKAVKGKGAWYWAHLEPILLRNPDTGLPKAVKLRCSLCDAVFSASNPSRTASEHLKRGTCPNFTSPSSASAPTTAQISPSSMAKPISTIAPSGISHNRKRAPPSSYQVSPLAIVDPSHFPPSDVGCYSSPLPQQQQQQHHHHLVLSGGKEDLGALAMLEDSVKKLKSPKASPSAPLSKAQAEAAISLLSEWVYESCGSVSFSSVEHPKFHAFLQQVGLPPIPRHDLFGARLDARFEEARCEADARIRDALFFQLASDGWKRRSTSVAALPGSAEDNMVGLMVNLPNGTSIFRKAIFTNGPVPSKYAEEIMWDAIGGISKGVVQQCAGIVSDKFKSKALRELESRNHWMVNLSCQLQGFNSLIKDFMRGLPLFRAVIANCSKLAHFFNTKSQVRGTFHKFQLQELDHAGMLRTVPDFPSSDSCGGGSAATDIAYLVSNFGPTFAMLEDVMTSARALHLVVLDESYKLTCTEDPVGREVAEMIMERGFWNDLEAVHSLVKLIMVMAREMEAERPLVGQCLPLWDALRSKVKEWCNKFNISESPVEKVIDKRFKKNYHPAWSAAYILDPLYLIKDTSGKYLPPFKCLTPEQEKDVDKLITRMVSPEEAHIALMELMKWRSEGLDPLYAQAVQLKQRDPATGKMRIANPQSSRLVWETCLSEFKLLGKVAIRLIFLRATSCGFKCNLSFLKWVVAHRRSRVAMDRAQKMVFIAANSKLERDFSCEEEKDMELFSNGDDDVLNEVYMDASRV